MENLQTQFGCDSMVTTQIMVLTSPNENISRKKLKFSIYPNPHSHSAYLSFTTKKHFQTKIHLFDALGKLIFSDDFYHKKSGFDYPIFEGQSDLPKGVYFF